MLKQKKTTTFFVMEMKESGGVRWQRLLAGPLHSRFRMRKVLKRIRARVPNAQGFRFVSYY